MFTLNNLIFFIICIIPIFILNKLFSKQRIPKGLKELPKTSGWPLIGVLFTFKEPLYAYLDKLKQNHGPIFKFTMGCRDIIVLNTSSMMQKTLKDMGNNFSGRWKNIIVQTTIHNSGILFKDKEWWAIQRNFVLKVLRDFGFGKQRSHEIVNSECFFLTKEIEDNCGKVIKANELFPKYMVNVISKLVMNMRFEITDPNFRRISDVVEKVAHNNSPSVTLLLMYPILERVPVFSHFLLWLCGRDQALSEIHNFIKQIIEEHEKHLNPDNEGEDVIDVFLKEKHKLDESGVKNHTFTDWQLIRVAFELFVAGYETTSTTMWWSMMLLGKHQQIQEKVHNEIIEVIGSGRLPTIADKKSLTYTQAVMDEILRFSSVVPLSLTHRVFENTSINGYFIPKNSIVFPNIYSVHHDKDTWEKPFEFYPEHFLTTVDGEVKYTPRAELMPFSIGKRQCLGESLARLEYFIFLTSILQRFKVRIPKTISDEEFQRALVGSSGTIRAPLRGEIIFDPSN